MVSPRCFLFSKQQRKIYEVKSAILLFSLMINFQRVHANLRKTYQEYSYCDMFNFVKRTLPKRTCALTHF
jgi:hypothetical protein